jgi:SAM-dependent methyltransferase
MITNIFKRKQFDETAYLNLHPDVRKAVEEGLFKSGSHHYEVCGKREGRALDSASNLTSREIKALQSIDKNGLGLEIGPSHNPIAPKSKGYNVHILDHLNAADLRVKYADHGVNLDNIEEVDFVWSGEPIHELIGNTHQYDWIIASHLIEHVPDLISFFQECEILLKENGVLFLVIPDKRYCFDALMPPSTTGELLDAWIQKRTKPTPGQVFDHFANASMRHGNIAWADDGGGGVDKLVHEFAEAADAFKRASSSDEYIDVHCWRFTPNSFKLILHDLKKINLTNMTVVKTFKADGCEFYISLMKSSQDCEVIDRFGCLKFHT